MVRLGSLWEFAGLSFLLSKQNIQKCLNPKATFPWTPTIAQPPHPWIWETSRIRAAGMVNLGSWDRKFWYSGDSPGGKMGQMTPGQYAYVCRVGLKSQISECQESTLMVRSACPLRKVECPEVLFVMYKFCFTKQQYTEIILAEIKWKHFNRNIVL